MKSIIIVVGFLFTAPVSLPLLSSASAAIDGPSAVGGERVADLSAELPARWRWKRDPVRFDHMYMQDDLLVRRQRLGR